MNKNIKKQKQKPKEEYLGEILEELEKYPSSFKLTLEKKDKEIEQYIKQLNETKIKYQNLFDENKQLKENKKHKEQQQQRQQQQQQQQKEELEKHEKYYQPEKIKYYR